MNIIEVEQNEEDHKEFLTGIYGSVNVCGYEYDSGPLLREIDPTAFRCSRAETLPQYQCGECDKIFEENEKAEAEECCKEENRDHSHDDEEEEEEE